MHRLKRLSLAAAVAVILLAPGPARSDGPFSFFAISPCRAVDTRFGNAPALLSGVTRTFQMQGVCGIPVGAKAVAVNATAVSPTNAGYLTLFPSNISQPTVATVNFSAGVFATNNGGIVSLGVALGGDLSVFPFLAGGSGSVDLVLDVTGYFADPL
jgi:hypothetical protein